MTFVSRLCIFLLATSACSPNPVSQQQLSSKGAPDDGFVTAYARADGRSEIRCLGDRFSAECGTEEIGPEQWFADCSDESFECVASNADIMAVPKAGLQSELRYRLRGVEFHVARCFDGPSCEQAMIVASCVDVAQCSCRPGWKEGRTTVFYHKTEIGVEAFYTLPRRPELSEELLQDAVPLLTYNLRSDRGFLSSAALWKLDPYEFKC